MIFREDLLQYIWKFGLFDHQNLQTTVGEQVEIISAGLHQHHAGPDFYGAKIKIGNTLWAGSIEIHLKSSDWVKHLHQFDGAYNSVILHVVYHYDIDVQTADRQILPVLVLENRVSDELISRYQNFVFTQEVTFPCEKIIRFADVFTVENWLDRMLAERLERRSGLILNQLQKINNNWEELFYHLLAANFGFKLNALPFELLAKSLPLPILLKHRDNLYQTEALLFGQAGFLEDVLDDDYYLQLQKEYFFLQKKYHLEPIDRFLWKFLRLRPLNFPTVRIAQFAAVFHHSGRFMAEIMEAKQPDDIHAVFTGIKPSVYWETHFHFGKISKPITKPIGRASAENIMTNTVSLLLFAYGQHSKSEKHTDNAIKMLQNLPYDRNNIIRKFKTSGVRIKSAAVSQAVIELKNNYCDKKRCLNCGIGIKLLKID